QRMHPVGGGVPRRARVHHRHPAAGPRQHQPRAQSRRPAADDNHVPDVLFHWLLPSLTQHDPLPRRLANLISEWQNRRVDDELDRTLDAVGPRLKRLRLRREITLTDLAEETGISASTLSRLEAGLRRPTLEQLLPLARAYGVTLDELVDAPPTG